MATMTDRTDKETGGESNLGDLELSILNVLWQGSWLTVRDVYETLRETRRVAYTTVMTVLTRLAKRRYVEQQKDGKSYLYKALVSRDALTGSYLRRIVDRLFGGRREGFYSFLVREEADLTPEKLEELRRDLDKARRGKKDRQEKL